MRNFDSVVDRPIQHPVFVQAEETSLTVTEVSAEPVRMRAHNGAMYLTKADAEWEWQDLRDYVIAEIEARHGMFPRGKEFAEAQIFKSFLARWPGQAVAIARYGFEVCGGIWASAPISINRFCLNSDPYFAQKIAPRLVESPTQAW